MTINHGENMQSYYIKLKSFYDTLGDVKPSQPYSYTYGDRPAFEFSFLPNEIAEGDTLVFAVDNDMVFYDSAPENLLHSASCMVVVRHDVTAEEATAGKVQLRIETRTVKFRDVTNGKVRPVEVISGLYRRRGDGDGLNYVLMARGRAFANGIIADYDALPEPITTDEYYTRGDIDGLLGEKADAATLVAHTDNSDIHVTLQDKSTWDSKADVTDIGNATVTITQGGVSKGSFSVNASENVTIEVNDGTQADWNETDTTSPAYIQNKPSVYTKTETDGMLDAKADKASVYTKGETNSLLDAKADKTSVYTKDETNALLNDKADKATTIAGYGITDAYTKTEVDAKVSGVYRYRGTVSTYADLPSSGQEVGDVWNIETADSTHGIKAGDNVAWNGSVWDALSGEVDLTPFALKAEAGTDHNHDGTYIKTSGETVVATRNFAIKAAYTDSTASSRTGYVIGLNGNTIQIGGNGNCDRITLSTAGFGLSFYNYDKSIIVKDTDANKTYFSFKGGDLNVSSSLSEAGTKLSDKYAAITHDHEGVYLPITGGQVNGSISATEHVFATDHISTNGQLSGKTVVATDGIQQAISVIPNTTTACALSEGVYSHIPDSAPTYTLPAVADTGRTHEIVLNVRFGGAALSYSFEDSSGNAVAPLSTPSVEDGTVISFLCRHEPLLEQWVIMPVSLGRREVTA